MYYTALNQYHVVMEAAPQFWQDPQFLDNVYVSSPSGARVPLSALAHYEPETAPLTINHQELFPAVTISFNLPAGVSLGQAEERYQRGGGSHRAAGAPFTLCTQARRRRIRIR